MRPRYRSVLKAINLLAVVKDGLDLFLTPFVNNLKKLYCEDATLSVGNENRIFFGGHIAFLADNLAAQSLGGFKQSLSFALRICRSCFVTRTLSKTCFTEESCTLRTTESHFQRCQLLTGPLKEHFSIIHRLSILEEVPGFSVVNGILHDIMHDMYEGVVPYEVKLLLHHCVQSKYFTLKVAVNERLQSYDLKDNKPTLIDERVFNNDSDSKLRQSASQMMTLAFELPLIIGDVIPVGDNNWEAFLLLLRIKDVNRTYM